MRKPALGLPSTSFLAAARKAVLGESQGVLVPVLTTSLIERFASRSKVDFHNKLLSVMRFGLGGHSETSVNKGNS